MLSLFHSTLTLFSIALLFIALGTLLWFVYRVLLRRFLRARRISNLRLKRMIEETHESPKQE